MEWKYEDGRIYSVDEKGLLMAEATYVTKKHGEVVINRTYVSPNLRGQGIAGKMMNIVVEYLRRNNLKATATCSYAQSWLKKNEEICSDILGNQ